jgi:uncharacterized protein YkwD
MPTPKRPLPQRAITTLIALIALLATACSPALQAQLRSGGSATTAPTTSTERQVINAVNEYRAAHGLSALHVHANLEAKARTWATWMAEGHCGRNTEGIPTICHSSLASGITVHWSRLEENVGNASPATAVTAITTGFEHSPEHAANMLNTEIVDIGVGAAYSGNVIYITEEFMAP